MQYLDDWNSETRETTNAFVRTRTNQPSYEFYKEVKHFKIAGSDSGKPHEMGYDVIHLIYDTKEMDCQIDSIVVKSVSYKKPKIRKTW